MPRRGRGEGHVEQLPSGKWRAEVGLGVDSQTGKQTRFRKTFDTKKEATAAIRAALNDVEKGTYVADNKLTLSEWLDRWLAMKKPKVEEGTYEHDRFRVDAHLKPYLGATPLGSLRAIHVEEMLAKMAEAGQTTSERQKAGAVLRAALNDAIRLSLLSVNVTKAVKLPKVVRPPKTCLNLEQAQRLLSVTANHRLGAWIALALDAGMRPGEINALHWHGVDLAAGTVFVTQNLLERGGRLRLKEAKNKWSRRIISLAPCTVESLRRHRDAMLAEGRDLESGPVFCDADGGLLRQSNFHNRVLSPAIKRADIPKIRPYDLRHTNATLLLSKDVNVRVVSERLGHESIETTLKHYAHALPSMQERAATAVQSMFATIIPQVIPQGKNGRATIDVSDWQI